MTRRDCVVHTFPLSGTGTTVHMTVRDQDVTGISYETGDDCLPGRVTIRAGGSSVVLDATTIARASKLILGESIGRGSEG